MVDRHFVIEQSDIGFAGGLYKSSVPYNAGKKAARALFTMIKHGVAYQEDTTKNARYSKHSAYAQFASRKKIKFVIRETNTDKLFAYEGTMTKLKEPKVISRNGVNITIEKEIKIKACTLQASD